MSDPTDTKQDAPPSSELCDQISRSLGSVWRDHNGGRSSVTTEVRGDVIRCVIAVKAEQPDPEAEEDIAEDNGVVRTTDSIRYRVDVMAAIGKSTRRKVIAYIPKVDKKTEVKTETFIVDRSLGKQG